MQQMGIEYFCLNREKPPKIRTYTKLYTNYLRIHLKVVYSQAFLVEDGETGK